jgi:hypothetical protein
MAARTTSPNIARPVPVSRIKTDCDDERADSRVNNENTQFEDTESPLAQGSVEGINYEMLLKHVSKLKHSRLMTKTRNAGDGRGQDELLVGC